MSNQRITSKHLLGAIFASILMTSPSLAQQTPFDDQEGKKKETERIEGQFGLVSNSGPLDKDATAVQSEADLAAKLQITAIDETVTAVFSTALTTGNVSIVPKGNGDFDISSRHHQVALRAAVPINSSEANSVTDFKNLGDDATLDLSYTFFRMNRTSGGNYYKYLNRFARKCITQSYSDWSRARFQQNGQQGKVEEAAILAAYDAYLGQPGARSWQGAITTAASTSGTDKKPLAPNFGPIVLEQCGLGKGPIQNNGDLERRYGKLALDANEYAQFKNTYYKANNIVFAGASTEIGYEKFDVLNRPTFQIDDVDRVGFDLSAYAGLVGADGRWSARVSAGYARGYEAEDEVEFCRTVLAMQTEECISGQDGEPTRKNTSYVKLEGRFVLTEDSNGQPSIAMAPEVSYDIEDDNVVFDLPIYLQRSKSTGLDGGIRIGYETKDSDFGIGVFVGIPFSTWF